MADAGGVTLADTQIGSKAPCPLLANVDRDHTDLSTVLDTMQTELDYLTEATEVTLSAAADRVVNIATTSALTTGVIASMTVSQTMTAAGASTEAAQFTMTTDYALGTWANALCAKVDLSDTGRVTGLAGVVCAELDMPAGACATGTYSIFEAELNCPTSYTGAVPINIFEINSWGATKAQFDTYGNFFELTGVSVASGKVFQENTAGAATHALRCKIAGTQYYMMLTSTGA